MSSAAAADLVVIVGGGTMGVGIAEVMLAAGCSVHVVESTAAEARSTGQRLHEQLQRTRNRHPDVLPSASDTRITVAVGYAAAAEATLVVEAVPENLELKLDVLGAVARSVGADALIASNTSALSISDLAAGVAGPERFLGMHFFNPVPRSQLVELVTGERTSAATVTRARAWVERLGRTAVVVRDSPGFASSRLGVALGMEAIRMFEEGVASAEDIDTAMVLGYRHPMGPLRLTDLVGLDIRLGIAEYLTAELGERFAPPQLLRSMVAEGRLGKKTGQGFYTW
ncbi:MAG: 3-hydroxyacyl-CoA dehydrogenase family protein [Candidatus Dormibacteria bacterium]